MAIERTAEQKSVAFKEWQASASRQRAEDNVLKCARKLMKEVMHAKFGPDWRESDAQDVANRTGEATQEERDLIKYVIEMVTAPKKAEGAREGQGEEKE